MPFEPAPSTPEPPVSGSKYRPLYDFLKRQTGDEVILSFRAIECLIKRLLPKAAREPGWWALHDPKGAHPGASWQAAGFEACLSREHEAVAFQRIARSATDVG